MGESEEKPKIAQFNIRVDEDILRDYKDFCNNVGLHPNKQVISFMRWLPSADTMNISTFLSVIIEFNKRNSQEKE